jgi:hypothetical protein
MACQSAGVEGAVRVSLQQLCAGQVMTARQQFGRAQINVLNTVFVTELEFIEGEILFESNSAAEPADGTL